MACLLPQYANAFLEGLKNGEINPEKLSDMTSEERRDFLAKYVGKENAKFVNTQFESKLLLKNQKEGMINWAKNTSGLKPKAKTDLIARIEKLDKALSPTEENHFLSDIVEQRLGVHVTAEEAKTITDLTAKLKENFTNRTEKGNPYGKYKQQLVEFMRDHTPSQEYPTVLDMVKGNSAEFLSVLRAIKTGFDFSASLRQGAAYFGTKQWNDAFVRMFGYAKSKIAVDELEASMYSNKYSDQAMEVKHTLGLTLLGEKFTQREEAFASKLIKNIPLLRGSERAYEGFLNDVRFNRFVDVLGQLDKAGNGISENKTAMKDLATVIAASTGRGELGAMEHSAKALSTALFSPRFLTSRFQLLYNPLIKRGAARVEAIKSLSRMAGISVAIIGLIKMAGGNVEDDPTSSDFGKLKVGNTRFDMTFGMSPYITLMARMFRGKVKNSDTGKITKLNTGEFNGKTKLDVATSFIENKSSPVGRLVLDYLSGETVDGKKAGFGTPIKDQATHIVDSLVNPLLSSDAIDAFQQASGNNKIILGAVAGAASLVGIGVSTHNNDPRGAKWEELRNKKGEDVFKEASREYNELLQKSLEELRNKADYNKAAVTPDKDAKHNRADMIDKVKEQVSRKIINKFK